MLSLTAIYRQLRPVKPTQAMLDIALEDLSEGDIIFISIGCYPFTFVAQGTGSWCSHVGFIVKENDEWMVLESAVPRVRKTPLRAFIQRTAGYDLAIRRLPNQLTTDQIKALKRVAETKMGRFYHTGFKFESARQFCSKFVHQVFLEALGISLGKVQTLEALLEENPQANLHFWRTWYFGRIPWQRKTITPHSLLVDPQLITVIDLTQQDEKRGNLEPKATTGR